MGLTMVSHPSSPDYQSLFQQNEECPRRSKEWIQQLEILLEKVLQNTISLTLSDGDRHPMTNERRELGEEHVVVEEGFPITTTPIPTPPLVPPLGMVADIAPATTPTQAHEGIVPTHSPFWLPDNQDNSPDQPLFPFMIPPWCYHWVNQETNAPLQFPIDGTTPLQSSLPVTSIVALMIPTENLPFEFKYVRLANVSNTIITSSTSRYARK